MKKIWEKLILLLIIGLLAVPIVSYAQAPGGLFYYGQNPNVVAPTSGWTPETLAAKEQEIQTKLSTSNLSPIEKTQLETNLSYIKSEQGKIKPWIDAKNTLGKLDSGQTVSDQELSDTIAKLQNLIAENKLSGLAQISNRQVRDLASLTEEVAKRNNDAALGDRATHLGQLMDNNLTRAKSLDSSLMGGKGVPDVCGVTEPGCSFLRWVIAMPIHHIIVPVAAKVLELVNILFNLVFDVSVRHFSDYADTPAVQRGWTIARDLVNLSLIFVLIYAALGLILKADNGMKKVVTNVIVVALLVNFSAMFTGIVIDASNIVANQFYEMAGKSSPDGGAPDITGPMVDAATSGESVAKITDELRSQGSGSWWLIMTVIIQDILKIPFFVITSIVMGGAALMFFVRMIILIFLLMLSPLAVLAWALPSTNKYFSKWSHSLISNCIFAPAFFFLFGISVLTVSQGYFNNMAKNAGGASAADVGFVSNIIFAVMVNGMMVASLLIAKEFGAYGAAGTMGVLNRVRGAVGRNTLGRLGVLANDGNRFTRRWGLDDVRDWIQENKQMQRLRTFGNVLTFGGLEGLGVGIKSAADSMAQGKYGGTISREDIIKKEGTGAKMRKGKPDRIAAYISGLSWQAQKEAYAALSTRERADLDKRLRDPESGVMNVDLADRLRDRMPPEEQKKMDNAYRDSFREVRENKAFGDVMKAYEAYKKDADAKAIDPETNQVRLDKDGKEMTNTDYLRATLRSDDFHQEKLKDLTPEQLIDIAPHLKSGHYAYANNNYPALGAGNKKKFKDNRFRKLLDVLGKESSDNNRKKDNYDELVSRGDVVQEPTDTSDPKFAEKMKAYKEYVAKVGKIMKGMNETDIAGLDEETYLYETAVIDNLEIRDLTGIALNKGMPGKHKEVIKQRLLKHGRPEIKKWFKENMLGQAF